MKLKKKIRPTSLVALVLAMVLLIYQLPINIFQSVFAQTGGSSNIFTLQIENNGVLVSDANILVSNTSANFSESVATDTNGIAQFPELTKATFGQNNQFEFVVSKESDSKSFTLTLSEGTTDYYIYDISSGKEPTKIEKEITYNVSVNEFGEGTGTVKINGVVYNNQVQVKKDTPVEVEIVPADDSEIVAVNIDGVDHPADKAKFTKTMSSITADTTIEVEYAKKIHNITFNNVDLEFGKIKVEGKEITPKENTISVQHGKEVSFTIEPNYKYHVESVKIIDGQSTTDVKEENGKYKILNVKNDYSVVVAFAINTYTITFDSYTNGTIKDQEEKIINSNGGTVTVQHGDNSFFTVKPNVGHHVESIEIDGRDIDLKKDVEKTDDVLKYTFKDITKNHSVKVAFAINTYEVKAAVVGGNGAVNLNQSTVNHGGEVAVTVTPENNTYRLSSFKVNGEIIPGEELTEDDNNVITYTVKNIEEPSHIIVAFEPIPVLAGNVDNYVKIEPTSGEFIYQFKEANNEIRVYSKDATLDISPIAPNDRLNLFDDRFRWKNVYKIDKSTAIEKLYVKKNRGKRGERGKVNLEGKLLLVMDNAKPIIKEAILTGDNEVKVDDSVWYSGAVTVSGTIDNVKETFEGISYSTDIKKVYYSKGAYSQKDALEANFNSVNNSYSFETIDENYKGIYSIWAEDEAGNMSDVFIQEINIDKTNPTLADGESVTFVEQSKNYFSKVLNFLTFGTYFNSEIEVTVKVKDDASGVKAILLKSSDEKIKPQLVENSFKQDGLTAEAKFIIPANKFTASFDVEVTDNVNNTKSYLVSIDNSNIAADNSGIIMLEQDAPTADIEVTPKENVSSNGGNQYNGDATYTITVQDIDSGVNTVTINVNGKKHEYDYSQLTVKSGDKIKYTMNTDDEGIQINEDGSYHVSVYVIDNAGNTYTKEMTIYKDATNPVITDFIFETQDDNGNFARIDETKEFSDSVELTEYGFYFKRPTRVTVKADDPIVKNEYTSNVQSLTVYLKDYDNGKIYAVLSNGSLKEITEEQIDKIVPVVATKDITFNVPATFKGQILAKATDKVNNTGKFETPDGTVIESNEKHLTETHIAFEKAATAFTDNNGLELYSKNADVKLTVTDTYSGISEIEWSVVAPYDTTNNQSGNIKINNDKTYAVGSNSEGWAQTSTEKNLVTEMTKTITVSNNSNDITLKVKMTDRAGNTSEDEVTFSIDKTNPTIDVSYDNNTQDPNFADYYNADRTATIVITERNFRPQDVVHNITNTGGTIPRLVGWTTVENHENPDETVHTAKIAYTADGDYTFDIAYKDNVGNVAPAYTPDTFTIDKTDPVINVSYNNNAASEGNYYKEARTATISITEHNFDTSRVKVTGVATDGGNPIAFPSISGWRTNGDVHTATISYAADGKYSFDIEYTDRAGNISADYNLDEFIIDQTAPVLEITGVEDKSANNGEVVPIVSYSDTNFNGNQVSIKLTGANRGPVELNGSFSDAPNGQVYTFKNFEELKENDDIYTLTATLADFAGNETSKTIIFSVNRFGSVYVFADALKNIEGTFIKDEIDVILTETNVDSLKAETIRVKMTKNGTPTDLVEGTDYTVTATGGNGKWSQYEYVIHKSLFAGDGRYTVSLYSEDNAGNINENIDETKKAEISFGVDKTAPVIVPIDFESGEQYPVDNKPVTVTVNDNLVLDGATIYLNGKEVEYEVDGENYTFNVNSSNSKQHVEVLAKDAAGNEYTKEIKDFLVTTNMFVRWYNNTPIFIGSIAGVGTLSVALTAYFMFFRKKKIVDENLDVEL